MEEIYEKFSKKILICLERNNTAFLVGGSKDMINSISKSYITYKTQKKTSS